MKQERQEKVARKEVWANRKRLPKLNLITPAIYQTSIYTTEAGITY